MFPRFPSSARCNGEGCKKDATFAVHPIIAFKAYTPRFWCNEHFLSFDATAPDEAVKIQHKGGPAGLSAFWKRHPPLYTVDASLRGKKI